jgi:hypothetical protein
VLNPVQFEKVQQSIMGNISAVTAHSQAIQQTDDFARRMGLTMSSAFENAMIKGRGLREVLAGIGQDIAQVIVRMAITEPAGRAITSAIGSSGISDAFKSIFAGGKAAGGPVAADRAYLVGESGPELFMPRGAGSIVPNAQLGQGGGAPAVNITINAIDMVSFASRVNELRGMISGWARQDYNSRGYATPLG